MSKNYTYLLKMKPLVSKIQTNVKELYLFVKNETAGFQNTD